MFIYLVHRSYLAEKKKTIIMKIKVVYLVGTSYYYVGASCVNKLSSCGNDLFVLWKPICYLKRTSYYLDTSYFVRTS